MGLILFWVYDRSPGQARTNLLFDKTFKMILITLRLASFPLLRPLHRLAGDLLEVIIQVAAAKEQPNMAKLKIVIPGGRGQVGHLLAAHFHEPDTQSRC